MAFVLALVSAAAVAAMFLAVARLPEHAPMLWVSALNQLVVGLVLSPFVVVTPPSWQGASALVVHRPRLLARRTPTSSSAKGRGRPPTSRR